MNDFVCFNAKMSQLNTGGPSSSCEIIIMRNESHSQIIKDYLRSLLGIKKVSQILNKNTSPHIREALRASLTYVINLEMNARLYVRKLGAAGIVRILLVVVNISVVYKSHQKQG